MYPESTLYRRQNNLSTESFYDFMTFIMNQALIKTFVATGGFTIQTMGLNQEEQRVG